MLPWKVLVTVQTWSLFKAAAPMTDNTIVGLQGLVDLFLYELFLLRADAGTTSDLFYIQKAEEDAGADTLVQLLGFLSPLFLQEVDWSHQTGSSFLLVSQS